MKRHFVFAVLISFLSLGAKAGSLQNLGFGLLASSAMPHMSVAMFCKGQYGRSGHRDDNKRVVCDTIGAFASVTTIAVVLLKEMEQVQSDAFAYEVDGDISPELQSVVEKVQIELESQGAILSFDEVINLINLIEMN